MTGDGTLCFLTSYASGKQSVPSPAAMCRSNYMWSPQLYKKNGLEIGFQEDHLETSISQIDALVNGQYKLPSILSLRHLSLRVGVDYMDLRGYVAHSELDSYKKFSIRKRSGGRRFIYVPNPKLMKIQRWINEFILKQIPVSSSSHAFTKGSSIKKCAIKHCGCRWLIKLDIQDFFESVSEIQVYRVFRQLGYSPLVAFELGRLCTVPTLSLSPRRNIKHWLVWKRNSVIRYYHQPALGYLPQGAATSPLISNLVMKGCDIKLEAIAFKYSLIYTRYSDDISFSTRSKSFTREEANSVIYEVYKVLAEQGYKPQYRKTKIISPGSKKIILGLNVEGDFPSLQKEYKDAIRQHLYYLEKFGVSEHIINRGFDSIWGFKSHLKGLIDYAKMIEPDFAEAMLQKFLSYDWPI